MAHLNIMLGVRIIRIQAIGFIHMINAVYKLLGIRKYNYKKLLPTKHMLAWLHSKPFDEIWKTAENYTKSMIPDSKLHSLTIDSLPDWLTGGLQSESDKNKIIMTRTGVSFEFTMEVISKTHGKENVQGVFTWIGVKLNTIKPQQKIWFDIGEKLLTCGSNGLLKIRIYETENNEIAQRAYCRDSEIHSQLC